jgi:hypothetical protein
MSQAGQLYLYGTLSNFIFQHILILTLCDLLGNIFSHGTLAHIVNANIEPRLHDHARLNTPLSRAPLDE